MVAEVAVLYTIMPATCAVSGAGASVLLSGNRVRRVPLVVLSSSKSAFGLIVAGYCLFWFGLSPAGLPERLPRIQGVVFYAWGNDVCKKEIEQLFSSVTKRFQEPVSGAKLKAPFPRKQQYKILYLK